MNKQELMLDSMGKFRTQSLFLEMGYGESSVYTLKDEDYTYNGKVFPSIKRLYLEMADPTEYTFAKAHLLGWRHWQRLCENKLIRNHIDEWREELEVSNPVGFVPVQISVFGLSKPANTAITALVAPNTFSILVYSYLTSDIAATILALAIDSSATIYLSGQYEVA